MEHAAVATNGIKLHVVKSGPETGAMAILLHGFPEFWYAWRKQIPQLASAGYHVWAPDQRGYNLSDKPRSIDAYTIDKLGADVLGLMDAAGREKVVLVGHDWGAMIAWLFAMVHPQKVDRIAALNGMHPVAFRNAMGSLSHLRQTYYGLVFQIPFLPEILLRARNYSWLRRIYSGHNTLGGLPPQEDQQAWLQAMSRPGALTAMVNYYRGAGQMMKFLKTAVQPVKVPSMLIWGERDGIGIDTALPTNHWAPGLEVMRIAEAGHWPHSDQPEIVNEALLRFLER